MIIIILLYYIL